MREVEFRAWDKLCNPPRMKSWEQLLAQYQLTQVFTGGSDYFVLMQFIGIKDIHGKKVFQGDIVKVKETIYTNCSREEVKEIREFTGEVIWYQYGWHVARKVQKGTIYHDLFLWNIEGEEDDTMEILGNRWDNPEMAVLE